MGYDISVLRAIVRLLRYRRAAHHEALLARVVGERASLDAALERLARDGLVTLEPSISLTLAGLAVAVASMPRAPARPTVSRSEVRAHAPAA